MLTKTVFKDFIVKCADHLIESTFKIKDGIWSFDSTDSYFLSSFTN